MKRIALAAAMALSMAGWVRAQAISARRVTPNLSNNIDRPLRYHPDGGDFVIENGEEFFNRPLYGGNTAFRVDAGDKPEFTMYLPGRGGNLRLGIKTASGAKWLITAEHITARYRPGGMVYDIHDSVLGAGGSLHLEVYAMAITEGVIVRIDAAGTVAGLELVWAYGGVNGQRGTRDGDIGTERVPISEYFQLSPDFCKGNTFETADGSFTLHSTPATIFGRVPVGAKSGIADSKQWADVNALLSSVKDTPAELPVVVGRTALTSGAPQYLSLQRLDATASADLQTYREVTATRPAETVQTSKNLAAFAADDLPRVFGDTQAYFKTLRQRVTIDTPDPFINAAASALNVAGDAVWDTPQQTIMHGAIAWRTKLLGWRGPYLLDALGWHDRARANIEYWATRQNVRPVPETIPPADEAVNLSRNEAGLHSNGDISNSHYDMNLVHIDAVFRHILWTGDVEFARREWPIIERHLAWEQRLFRRTFGDEKLPLYEAYAAIWASDDLQYGGGGAAHSSAYNFYHNKMAARVAKLVGKDPAPYEKEADLIAKAMRQYLWLGDRGNFAEFRDSLGMQLAHPSAALWTVYHTIDSEVPTSIEGWQMTRSIDTQIPHIPVQGVGVPGNESWYVMPTTTWMPYLWSLNNVCMNENAHTTLAFWQAGRSEEAFRNLTGALLASMYMGISPGNVGTMDYLDVYRRESQRDFGDGSGTLSRALVEGLFGIKPDAIAGELRFAPGFPEKWDRASIQHPDLAFNWRREGETDRFTIESRFAKSMAVRLIWPAHRDDLAGVMVNGQPAKWSAVDDAIGTPRIEIEAPAAAKWDIAITWKGQPITRVPQAIQVQKGQPIHVAIAGLQSASPGVVDPQHAIDPVAMVPSSSVAFDSKASGSPGSHTIFVRVKQGAMSWWMPQDISISDAPSNVATAIDWAKAPNPADRYETVDLSKYFNDQVTQIFRKEYRSPRSQGVSLAIPKRGIGAWAGDANANAVIDDNGLRAAAAANNGKITMPNGVSFATPGTGDAANIIFTSQWDNFPREATVPLTGHAKHVMLLMAGSTNPMQSRFENGEVVVTYVDGSTARLALQNPTTWWPIEQDYFIDDFQFRNTNPLPPRVNLRTGEIRLLSSETFKGKGGSIQGGAATVLDLPLDPTKELKSLKVHTLANEVVIGLMSATLSR